MMKFYKLILTALVTFLIFSIVIQAQVVVEKSKDKVVIDGKQYYIHITKKGETAYSISKAYGISVQDLTKDNPFLEGGLKTGQSLRIPIVEKTVKPVTAIKTNKPSKDNSKFIYHKLIAGETAFALSKKYGVSEDEIVQSNPGLEINKMPLGYEIAIPRREFNITENKLPAPEKSIIQHKVVKGENLYSIAEKYGVTVKELRHENKGLLFPKVDEYIRVPVQIIAEVVQSELLKTDSAAIAKEVIINLPERPLVITPVNNLKGSFNIALLLPLYFEENAIRSVIDTSQVVKGKSILKIINRPDEWIYPESLGFLELYEGVLIAADTLRSLGLDINLHVYDIKSDTIAVTRLIESDDLKNMDLIIGPVYSHNLSIVAAYANTYMIPVISPVPLKNNTPLINNPYLYKVNPSVEVAQDAISRRLVNFAYNNFVFIHSDSTHINPDIDTFKNKIFKELSSKIPYEEIKFKEFIFYSRSNLDEDSINRLEHALSDKTRNFVIIASEEPPMISECVANLKTLSKKFDIQVMGYPAMRELDNEDWKDYFDLGVELYTPFWIDYNSKDVKNFNRTFRQKFLTEPIESSYAWEGYDLTYYFISGLAIHGKTFISNPDMHNPDLLMTSFQFRRKSDGSGFENQKLYLIKFANDMELKLLDKPNLNVR
jgi:LysM repeat protein/ABC-type branched-subunit amino acid transport system substrate-binding protein